jgi:hypothetical protein
MTDDDPLADQARREFETVFPGAAKRLAGMTIQEISAWARRRFKAMLPEIRELADDPWLTDEERARVEAMLVDPRVTGRGLH